MWSARDLQNDLIHFFWIILPCLNQIVGIRGPSLTPQFLHVSQHLTFHKGETAILKCTVQNLGTKSVTWRKLPYITPITTGRTLFAQDPRFEAVHIPWKNQWNLSIKNVQKHDAGIYECQVGARGKNLRQNITLSVIDAILERKPEIKITGKKFPEKGSSIVLLCKATGEKYPPDAIEWFKNGKRLTTDHYRKLTIKDHVAQNAGVLTSSLEIKNAKLEDNGTYICRAKSHNEDTITTSITVNVLSAGTNYAKRGTPNESSRSESVDAHDAAKYVQSTAGLICFLILFQNIARSFLLS